MFRIIKFDVRPDFLELMNDKHFPVIKSQNYSCRVQVRDLM
jgi:hypothetical protein